MKQFRLILIGLFVALPLVSIAQEKAPKADPSTPGAVYDAVGRIFGAQVPDSITETPVGGVFEVVLGAEIYYVTSDGKHLFRGDLFALDSRTNLTDQRRAGMRKAALEQLDEKELIVFSPEGKEAKHSVTVFTDVDCGYCAKLHAEMQAYLDQGIEVRYAAFPRGGVRSKTFTTMVSVWCAEDQHQAMTDAKARRPVSEATCTNPVEKHYKLGGQFGISGTPTIVLENGDVLPGYVPADRLPKVIEERLKQNSTS